MRYRVVHCKRYVTYNVQRASALALTRRYAFAYGPIRISHPLVFLFVWVRLFFIFNANAESYSPFYD